MLVRHRQAWRSCATRDLAQRERDYLQAQYRRRTQASTLIGVVGLAVAGGVWVTGPRMMLCYWCGVCLLVMWMGWLAMADLVSTQLYFKRLREDYAVEHRTLNAELDRLRRRHSNGRKVIEPGEPLQNEEDH